MYGATNSWNFAVAAVENTSTALPRAPRAAQTHVKAVGVAQVVTQPLREPSLIASTQISMRPLPPAVRCCSPLDRTVNEPSSMYQMARASGVSALRYSSGEELLAVAEVDRTLQLGQLGQRGEVDETCALGVLGAECLMLPSSAVFHSRYSTCLAPCPSRNRTPLRSRRFGDRFPSPISEPSTTWNC